MDAARAALSPHSRVRAAVRILPIGLATVLLSGHVGTNDVTFAGEAGPYRVRVSVRLPGVIPGLADINIRVADDDVQQVLVTALRRINNVGEAPPPDVASPVRGAAGLHAAQLWLMTRGPHRVIVTVEGARGSGTIDIPITATATRRLAMTGRLQMGLAAGGLFLIAGLLTIVGAAVRESVLEPGASPGTRERARARLAIGATIVLLGVFLFGGWTWIRAEAALFSRRIDRPWSAVASLTRAGGTARLDVAITDSLWIMRDDPAWLGRNNRSRRADLIADHGKLMHMFMVREPDLDAFAHVHPETRDGNTFSVALPPLPHGRYRVYADVAHEDGSARTLVTRVEVPATLESLRRSDDSPPPADRDDAWWDTAADENGDGFTMRWINREEALVAGTDVELAFEVRAPEGGPATLEPYMGMGGHLMLNRDDGEVFIHAHPAGMITMPAPSVSAADGADANAMDGMVHAVPSGVIQFPIVAPRAGRYRIWVQVRVGGRVLTRAFDAEIR